MARRTKEEIQAWREKMGELSTFVSNMSSVEKAELEAQFGAVITAEGRPLSAWNTVFLLKQAERPLGQVGGFEQWKRVGRVVKKDEHAAGVIAVPMNSKEEIEPTEEPTARPRFRFVPVFAVDQTEVLA